MKEAKSTRISLNKFPDDILLHIFSFLEVKGIARLKSVSRRFQTLCISAPSFSFTHNHPPHSSNCSCRHIFNFMKTLRRQRPHDVKINLLSFSSFCMKTRHRKLHMQWLCSLFKSFHVGELSLDYELPSIFVSLPNFQSLKVLKLVMPDEHRISVKLPEVKLASLERLHIEGIQNSVGEWVSQSFPSLKSLFLSHVNVPLVFKKQLDLIIQSSCLEDLTLRECCGFKSARIITDKLRALSYINCAGRFCDLCDFDLKKEDEIVVEVSAPNLQSFTWGGPPARLCYDKMTFKNLHTATVTLIMYHNLNLAKQLFEAIQWVEILSFDWFMIRTLYNMPLIPVGNVRHFEIRVNRGLCFYHFDDILINFLERISNLEILSLTPYDHEKGNLPFDFKAVLMRCKINSWKNIKGLKKVKFTTGNMLYSMTFLIGMLKKSCVDLEEMTLFYPSSFHNSMVRFLNSLETASSDLSINLPLTNRRTKRCRDDESC